VRLKEKQLQAGTVYFMGVSSTAVAHEGIPIALPGDLRQGCSEEIAANGCVRCTLTGRLKDVPSEFEPLFGDHIPRLYVLVEELTITARAVDVPLLATGAVIAKTLRLGNRPTQVWERADGIFAAFVSFEPGRRGAIREAAEWLDEVYVRGLVDGEVVTDFDERTRRFANAVFSLDRVMRGLVPDRDAVEVLDRCGAPDSVRAQLANQINLLNSHVTLVAGDRNVLQQGDRNVVQQGDRNVVQQGDRNVLQQVKKRAHESMAFKLFGVVTIAVTVVAVLLWVFASADIGKVGLAIALVSGIAAGLHLLRG
jgi:hypothetical protein